MSPFDILTHEHKIVLLVLKGAEREASMIEKTRKIRAEQIEKMLDFFRTFVDRCHHAKEENHLFPLLEERGISRDQGPIGVMLHEHDDGRAQIKAIADALPRAGGGDPEAIEEIRRNLLAYVRLLRGHIEKEDKVLYPMADRLLDDRDRAELVEAFERVESGEIGEGVHERYHQLAHELAGA